MWILRVIGPFYKKKVLIKTIILLVGTYKNCNSWGTTLLSFELGTSTFSKNVSTKYLAVKSGISFENRTFIIIYA